MEILFAVVLDWSIQKNLNQEDVYEFFSIFLEGLLMRGDNPRLIGGSSFGLNKVLRHSNF